MATLKAFKGLRPPQEIVKELGADKLIASSIREEDGYFTGEIKKTCFSRSKKNHVCLGPRTRCQTH